MVSYFLKYTIKIKKSGSHQYLTVSFSVRTWCFKPNAPLPQPSGHKKVKKGTGHVFYMANPSHTTESARKEMFWMHKYSNNVHCWVHYEPLMVVLFGKVGLIYWWKHGKQLLSIWNVHLMQMTQGHTVQVICSAKSYVLSQHYQTKNFTKGMFI